MATMPASGNPISMSQMRTVWGLSGSLSMSAMYKGGSNVEDNILNTNITTSGNPINFGGFYGKQTQTTKGHFPAQPKNNCPLKRVS